MANGSFNLNWSNDYGSHLEGVIYWESTPNVAQNTSVVAASIHVRKKDTTQGLTIPTEGTWTYELTIGGNRISGSCYASVLEDYVQVGWHQVTGIAHNNDGTKAITISGAVTGPAGTSYASKTTSGSASVTLDTIARASTVTAAGNVTLGNACSVKWKPASSSFRYKLKFSLGGWSYTTGAIHPNRTTDYTYTGYVIPLEVAKQFDTPAVAMTVTLYTYSDSAATSQVGAADTEIFTVTVPDNGGTKPVVSMSLAPEDSPFAGVYLQRKSKVKAALSAADPYGAVINSIGMTVNGKSYGGTSATSDFLTVPGSVTVTGYATNSRGHTGKTEASITVIAYDDPKILDVSVFRCDSNGVEAESGENVRIIATRSYSKVVHNGTQLNSCQIQYRFGQEGVVPGAWTQILAADAAGDTVDIVLDAVFDKTKNYTMQVRAVDEAGDPGVTTVKIPTENVFWHRDGAKGSLTFGGYVKKENTFCIASGKKLEIEDDPTEEGHGANKRYVDALINKIYPVGAVYISVNSTDPGTLFGGTWERLKDRFLLAAGNRYPAGATGGAETVTLTVNEMPGHHHDVIRHTNLDESWDLYGLVEGNHGSAAEKYIPGPQVMKAAGGGQAHNNMPPYLAVYMWKRTA